MLRDIQQAIRTLARSPAYTTAAVLTLALGIGATTATFSVLRSVILEPLAYAPVNRVVVAEERDSAGNDRLASYLTFQDWRAGTNVFEALAFLRGLGTVMKTEAGSERLVGAFVTEDFFRVLPEPALVGRTFGPGDWAPAAPASVILSFQFWRRRFGGEPMAVGQNIVLSNRSYTVVGVMPPDFVYPVWADVYAPISAILSTDSALQARGVHVDSRVVGRLRAGSDTVAGRRALSAVAARLADTYPADNKGWGSVTLSPMATEVIGDTGPQLRFLMVAAALVLLIACVNVANLSLARATARSRELAIRTALGASRGALLRLLAAESILVGLMAAGLGLVGALGLTRLIKSVGRDVLPRVDTITVYGQAVLWSTALAVVTVVVVGLLPTLRLSPDALTSGLKQGGRTGTGAGKHRLRAALVVAELALALGLLDGAGLLFRTLQRLQEVQIGLDVDQLLVVPINPPSPQYDDPQRAVDLYKAVAEAVAGVPGVQSVGLTNHVPLSGSSVFSRIEVDGMPANPNNTEEVLFREVDDKYFRTAGIRLVDGRDFTQADILHPGDAVLVNHALAQRYWPNRNPIGQRVTVFKAAQGRADFGEPVRATVVGVVGDVRHFAPDVDIVPEVYVPYTITVWPRMALVARVPTNQQQVVLQVRQAVLAVNPDIPLEGANFQSGVYRLSESLDDALAYRRLITRLLAAFAVPTLLLAALGIYGVIAYLVTQQQHEIAIRMALGSSTQAVMRLVLGQGIRLALVGVGLGTLAALAGTRLLRSQLYGLSPLDPASLLGAALILFSVGLLATYLPARRAAGVQPMRALAAE